jgi:hypothetical protein
VAAVVSSKTEAIKVLRAGETHIDELDLSKLDKEAKKTVRTEWRKIRKALLEKMTDEQVKSFRQAEKDRRTTRREARQSKRKAGPPTIRIERAWVNGVATMLEMVGKALVDGKDTLTFGLAAGKETHTPTTWVTKIAESMRKQVEKPTKAGGKGGVFLLVRRNVKDGSLSAYDDRFNSPKKAGTRAKKLSAFLEQTGFAGEFKIEPMSLDDARKAKVANLKEDSLAA